MERQKQISFLLKEIDYWKNEAQEKQNELDILRGEADWQ